LYGKSRLSQWLAFKTLLTHPSVGKTMILTDDEDFEIIAFNGITGECLTTDDVDSILILPTSTPDFEANIWSAVIDSERDWNDTEREYLRRNVSIRESIMQWAEFNYSDGCWTEANLEFLRPYWKVSADEMDTPSADPTQTTRNESKE
jgi:hypothetical protein